ncbi:hypothetical protein [Pedobacter psychroterrae]|uniref:Uncharacterized protein n=1 Tax=Pedobacter psychroterrae TaxID=2530453 RepID=A0A4R0NG70_9SPHI|nr:hypothetical protein [Pedobacter psychroterrae]TCC98273.1 hypothetical protein EZ437_18975 [Pedobacter psychroterrae]
MKATRRLAFLLAVASFGSVAQDKIPDSGSRPDATIVRSMRLWVPGGVEDRGDSMLVRNNLVLEPIKIFYQEGETNLTTGVTKNEPLRKKLQWYYITDVSKMAGMSFDVDKVPSRKTIETYTAVAV